MSSRRPTTLIDFGPNEEGATAIEYALIACLIAIVLIASVAVLGDRVSSHYGFIVNQITALSL